MGVQRHVVEHRVHPEPGGGAGRARRPSRTVYQIAEAGEGAVVVLRNHDTARELVQRIADYQLHDAEDKVPVRDPNRELRTYGVGAQIIGDLGIRKMRVLSAPWSIHGLAGFGLEVVEYVDCQ